MMHVRFEALAAFTLLSLVLAGCGSDHPDSQPAAQASAPASAAATPANESPQYHAELALAGGPSITANGEDIWVAVDVTNDGSASFGTQATPVHNVNLGAHTVDASGKVLDWNLARGRMPEVAPGATVKATIVLPVDKVLGHAVQLLPVEEEVAWFDKWGTKPLTLGPFEACASPSAGKVCDASGKPLPTTPVGE